MGFRFWTETPVFNVYKWDHDEAFKFITQSIDDKNSCGFVAYRDGEPVGFIMGFIEYMLFTQQKCLQENFVYVIPEERGSMAGYRLVKRWMKFGEENGAKDMWFKVTTGIDMEKNMKFFKGIGFETVGFEMRKEY